MLRSDRYAGTGQPAAADLTVTSDIGYIRFHGRNRENWWDGDNTSRFDYLYNEHELQSWLCRTEEIASKVKRLFIAFNNHHKGQAVKNAVEIYNLLKNHTELDPAEIKIVPEQGI